MCSGGENTAGCNRRTQARNAIAKACAPVLKTNSVQGVLVFGRREKRVSWEAEELISAFYSPIPGNTSLGLKFLRPSTVGTWSAEVCKPLVYYPVGESCTRKAIPQSTKKFIPLILQLLTPALPAASPVGASKEQ